MDVDVNVLEIALFTIVFMLVAIAFLIGRLDYHGRKTSLDRTISALRQTSQEEQTKLDGVRREKETLWREGVRAEEHVQRWEAMKADYEQLESMRGELESFEREESSRIDELERRRAEATRRLADAQQRLDSVPPEVFLDPDDWKAFVTQRKAEIEALDKALEDARRGNGELQTKKDELQKEAENLAESIERSKEELASRSQRLEAAKAALESVGTASIQFPEAPLNVAVTDRTEKPASDDKLGMFKVPPECLKGLKRASGERSEEEVLERFEAALEEAHLNYPRQIVRAFHTALKVNDLSPLTVLSGLSGTGKSQLPRAYARFVGIHFLHVPVEPGWDSPQDLLGFYDFVAERYRPTDRARALGHFDNAFAEDIGIERDREWDKRMLIILLDEMNLARTEYYFSEFLSRLEMRGPRNGDVGRSRGDSQIAIDLPYGEDEQPKHLYVPHNVLWVGTLNEDETTQALSDKVLDRANSIRFAPPDPNTLKEHSKAPDEIIESAEGYLPYDRWLKWSEEQQPGSGGSEVDDTLARLARLMQDAGRGFGYRIAQSIKAYILRYPGTDWRTPMVDQINMRLLPKLAGTELSACVQALDDLKSICSEELGNGAFANALENAQRTSEMTQIFTWPGYTYEDAG